MLKQTLVLGIMGLGLIMSTPTLARPYNNHHYNNHTWIQPVRHCVPGHRVNNRQARQKQRIRHGVNTGLLVRWEARELKQQQKRIKRAERRMRSDGCLTYDENRRLLNRLNRASNRIKQLKHNHVRRGYHRYRDNRGRN